MKIKIIVYLLLIVSCWSCPQHSEKKHFDFRKNIVNVRNKVQAIEIEDVLIGRFSICYFMDQYLIIIDTESPDKVIHLFNKHNFNYITSTGDRGPGPSELTAPGEIAVNEKDRIFYVSDHGKQKIYIFSLDSVLANPHYYPKETMNMDKTKFPSDYLYINDTLSIGRFILPIGNGDYRPSVAKWNMRTGEITLLNKNDHPKIERKRASFSASIEHCIFVECYHHHDLMAICDLDGNLKYYLYGSRWNDITQNRFSFFGNAAFCKDKIVACYSAGDENFIIDKDGRTIGGNYPSKFIVFDIHGNYIQTLETRYKISRFCYDAENNRIIMILDDEIQFANLDLNGII